MRSTVALAPAWTDGRERLGKKIDYKDFILKCFILTGLVVSGILAAKIGSLDGYGNLFKLQTYNSPLKALGAAFSLTFICFQMVRTVLWWRYRPYPLVEKNLPRVTVTGSRLQ